MLGICVSDTFAENNNHEFQQKISIVWALVEKMIKFAVESGGEIPDLAKKSIF